MNAVVPKRILVAEDELAFSSLLRFILEGEGYSVRIAQNGGQAWQALQHETFDLLITDHQMPDMDGQELCRLIRDEPRLAGLPIILITAKGFELKLRMLREEFQISSVFIKPFSIKQVVRAVNEHLAACAKHAAVEQ